MRGLKYRIWVATAVCIVMVYFYILESSKVNLRLLLEVAINTAEIGGFQILESRNNITISSKGLTEEGLQDSVTSADISSHCSMLQAIYNYYPNVEVISEEKVECDNVLLRYNQYLVSRPRLNIKDEWVFEKDVKIWIDPLDATHEFIEGLYKYVTTMVCVTVKGKPIIGVIHSPFEFSTSWAWVGKYEKSKDLESEDKEEINDVKRIIISRSHSGTIKERITEKLKDPHKLIVAAGAGYKALEVAKRRADAYLHITAIKKWDICAGNAILTALGGEMTDKYDKRIDYSENSNYVNENGLVATLKNHAAFLKVL